MSEISEIDQVHLRAVMLFMSETSEIVIIFNPRQTSPKVQKGVLHKYTGTRSLYMKIIYYHRGYIPSVSCSKWLEQTATGHSVCQWRACAAHTHTNLTNFKILRSSKHIYVETNAQNILT